MSLIKSALTILALLLLASSCASSDEAGEVEDYNYNNGGEESEGEVANAGDGEGDYGENDYGEDGEGVNNDAGNEFADNNYDYGEDGENINNLADSDDELNLGNENQAVSNDNLGLQQENNALLATNENLLNTGEGPSNIVNESSDPVVDTGYAGGGETEGGVVRYITGPTQILDASKQGSTGNLDRGDHPVIWGEGEFARLSDGRYIPSANLSAQGVGRPRTGGQWRSGSY